MMQNLQGLIFSFLVGIACMFSFCGLPQAQVQSGAIWDSVPQDLLLKLDILQDHEINLVFLPLSTPMSVLQEASVRGFEVVLITENRWNIRDLPTSIPERLLLLSNDEIVRRSLKGVIIASHPNLTSVQVVNSLMELKENVQNELDIDAFIITHQNPDVEVDYFLQFKEHNNVHSAIGIISSFTEFHPRLLHDYLIKYASHNSLLVFKGEKLANALKEDTGVGEVLSVFSFQAKPQISLPPPVTQSLKPGLPAIFLVSVLIVFLFISKLSHVYSTSLVRYFTGHKFFINDIFERHYRFGISALLVFLLMAVLPAMSLVVWFEVGLTEAGKEFLAYYLPLFQTKNGVFLFGFTLTVLLNALLISWIASVSVRSEIFAQSATLLLWPQHVSLLIFATTMLLAANDIGLQYIPWLVILIFMIPLLSFFVASIDFAFRPTFSLPVHLLLTVVLFGFIIGIVVWLLHHIYVVEDIFDMLKFL